MREDVDNGERPKGCSESQGIKIVMVSVSGEGLGREGHGFD